MGRPRSAGQPDHLQIGEAIAREREAAGLTQAQLADAIGADQAAISRLERGIAILTLARAKEIATALKIPIERLLAANANEPAAANG